MEELARRVVSEAKKRRITQSDLLEAINREWNNK